MIMIKCRYIIVSLLILIIFFSAAVSAETLSEGICVTPESETVYAENGSWVYSVELSVEGDYSVTLSSIVIKLYNYDGDYFTYERYDETGLQDSYKITPAQSRTFSGGLPSINDIYFIDLIFTGIANTGKELKGYARIHFIKGEKNPEVLSF